MLNQTMELGGGGGLDKSSLDLCASLNLSKLALCQKCHLVVAPLLDYHISQTLAREIQKLHATYQTRLEKDLHRYKRGFQKRILELKDSLRGQEAQKWESKLAEITKRHQFQLRDRAQRSVILQAEREKALT